MEHGRGSDSKEAKVGAGRHSNTPPVGGTGAKGPGGGEGSAVAPTPLAAQHEAERHADEAAHGHLVAGLDGRKKAVDVEPAARDAEDELDDDDIV